MRWRTLDLFCGAAGGWSLGLHRAGFQTVAACEVDPWRRAVFGRNNPGVVLYDDVRTLNAARLIRDLGFLPDIIAGSPPCQDASAANTKGRGVDGERTGLFFDAVRIVREVRPRWVLFENVPGLRTRGYDRVHDALEAASYTVWPLVVGAVHAGAPHLRKRVWIVALAKSAQEQMGRAGFAWPETERIPSIAAPMYGPSFAWGEPDRDRAEAFADASEPDAIGRRSLRRRRGWSKADAGIGIAPDAHKAGRQERRGAEPDGAEYTAAFGILGAFRDWNGWPPDLGRVDDGVSEALASRRGIGRACLAAYGDAVVPQVTEAIGRTIRRVDRAREAVE